LRDFLRKFGYSGYRKIAAVAHPDAGGDEEMMKAINNLWEEVDPRGR
jgi:hypothetical protein